MRNKKNQFEELIDAMMINEVAGLDTNLKTKLEGLDHIQKRIGILSILDKDRGQFMKILNTIKENNLSKAEHITNLVGMLREYVKVGEVEKKTLGEVMTPITLVNDMLDTLPKDVWTNPKLKWLDPCAGVGIFPSVIVERLMLGLKDFEFDEEKRYRHIVENMLYITELQAKNCFLFLVSFDPKDEYNVNIYNGSFLDKDFDNHMKNVWGLDKFDVIVMNPPYQELKEGNKKSQPLWDKFVTKTLDNLIEGGYLVAVHPSGWRNVDGVFKPIQNLLKSKEMLSLRMHSFKQGQETFGVATNYDYYCMKNINSNHNITKIICEDSSIEYLDISKTEFIPSENIKLILSLVAKEGEQKVEILYSRSAYGTDKNNMSKVQDNMFKYPCIYTVKSPDKNNAFTFYYSDDNTKGFFNMPKVIWGNGASGVNIDVNGEYGLTQFAYAIVDEPKNFENIKQAMLSEKFIRKIMNFKNSLGDKYNRKIIATFRKDFWKDFI